MSKPTVSESVRRLTGRGLLLEVGERQSGRRGRAGPTWPWTPTRGVRSACTPDRRDVLAQRHDLRGRLRAQSRQEVVAPVAAGRLVTLLRTAVREVLEDAHAPVLATTISAADPVDRFTGTARRAAALAVPDRRAGPGGGAGRPAPGADRRWTTT